MLFYFKHKWVTATSISCGTDVSAWFSLVNFKARCISVNRKRQRLNLLVQCRKNIIVKPENEIKSFSNIIRPQCVKETSMPLACIIHRNNELFAMWFQQMNRRIMHTNCALLSFSGVWYRQVNFVLPCHMGTLNWHWTLALDTASLILKCVEYWCNYIHGRHSIHCHRWYQLNHVDV